MYRLLPVSILLAVAFAPPLAARPAVPVDGQPFDAKLTRIGADWQLTFAAGGKERKLPAADLVYWGTCAETTQGPIVVTADGGLLVADVFKADKESLVADSPMFGELKLPLPSVAGIVFDPPAAQTQRDGLLTRVARAGGDSDRIILHNGDELAGVFEGMEEDDEGAVIVTIKTGVGPVKIKTDRIAALIFNPALKDAAAGAGLRAWAGFSDGTRLLAEKLVLGPSSLKITTAKVAGTLRVPSAAEQGSRGAGERGNGGAEGQTWETLPEDLVWLQPLGGRAVYLSRLKPAGYRHMPYLDLKWPYKTDRNVTGGMIRCDGRLYPIGLGMHSAARLTYSLDKPYRRFQAELGIDDSTAGRGSVRARVYVDGRQRHATETIRGGAAPVPISVDLSGAERLDLIIDFADRADEQDHANWLNARLIK